MVKKIGLLLLGIVCSTQAVCAPRTTKKELPLPYTYFENLYYCPPGPSFFNRDRHSSPEQSLVALLDIEKPHKWVPKQMERMEGTTLILIEPKELKYYLSHFFHLLEHLVGFWSFHGQKHADDVKLILLVSDGPFDRQHPWEGPNQINKHLIKALFPNAIVLKSEDFLTQYEEQPIQFAKAVVSDRRHTFDAPACKKINKMLGTAAPFFSREALNGFMQQLHTYAHANPQKGETLRVTYTKRGPPRTFSPKVEKELMDAISSIEGVSLQIVDFAKLSFEEQIQLISNTDILLGVHGNGLSHILFLPPHAGVIEVFPKDALALDYRFFADIRGLDYLGIISNLGPIGREEAYRLGAIGDVSPGVDSLDIRPILSFIQEERSKLLEAQ